MYCIGSVFDVICVFISILIICVMVVFGLRIGDSMGKVVIMLSSMRLIGLVVRGIMFFVI